MSLQPNQSGGGTSTGDNAITLDSGYRYMPYERIAGKSAADILKQVDKILQSTNVVLENHKGYLPAAQFAALKKAYCRYHWQMTNESQEDRAYYDQRIRESRILSQLYANRQTHQERAQVLLYKVETFQTKVLSASRNTHPQDGLVLFEDELTESLASSRSSTLDSFTSWFSLRAPRSTSPAGLEESDIQPSPAATHDAEGEEFIISVTHFPQPPNESTGSSEAESSDRTLVGTGSRIYRRMIAFENKDKRVEITDPKLYALEGNETYVAENALQAMSEIGQNLLNQSDMEILPGSQIATNTASQTQSLETTIEKFKKMSMDKK